MAELILTLTAGAGTAVTNPTIVTPIISEYGATGYNMESLLSEGSFELVNKSTGESAGYTIQESIDHIGDSDWLDENNVTYKMNYDTFHSKVDISNTLAKDGARLIHEATLYNDSLNPFDWDWGGLIENFMNKGQLTNELLFTNYQTGENFVTDFRSILDNIVDFWTPNIEQGTSIKFDMTGYNPSYKYARTSAKSNNMAWFTGASTGGQWIAVNTGLNGNMSTILYLLNNTGSAIRYNSISISESLPQIPANATTLASGRYNRVYYNNNNYISSGQLTFTNEQDAINYMESVKNGGDSREIVSPDLINPLFSNVSSEDLENISPSVETGKAIYPIDQNDYINFMNEANQNTEDGNTEDNAPLLEEFLFPYIDDVPEIPEDNPWEDDIEAPISPNKPFNPSQPSLPEAPELTQEQIDASLAGTTPDLTGIFPFCIPWDIYAIFEEFRAGRKAPYIEWTLESDLFGFSYTFELDMSIFDDVAALLRLLELIGFIIGLAVATRKLIGAGG